MKNRRRCWWAIVFLLLLLTGCAGDGGTSAPGESLIQESSGDLDVPASDPEEPLLSEASAEPEPVPEWELDVPENHGMDSEILRNLHTALEGTQIYAMLTVKDGVIVDEFYQEGQDETSVLRLNSCSKSFTSALIGIAIDEGLLAGIDVPIAEFFPQVVGTDKEDITIRNLLEHTSGLEWYEWGGSATTFWELNEADNWVDYVLARPMAAAPGTTFTYSTGGTHLLAAILEQVTEETLMEYTGGRLFEPLGMTSVRWRADPQGILDGGNGIEMTARDAARFGQLFLEGGEWNGKQLVPAEWVAQSTSVQVERWGSNGSYGFSWWVLSMDGYDTFYALGAMGQFIVVVPELDLVIVAASSMSGDTNAPYVYISDYILAACKNGQAS